MEQYSEIRTSISSQYGVDKLVVEDTIWMWGIIDVEVFPSQEFLQPGCYLFLEYGDEEGVSAEYVKNLKLVRTRYEDYFFAFDFSEKGKVYICVSEKEYPMIQRYIDIPKVAGVVTDPVVGRYYRTQNDPFYFTSTFSGDRLAVTATGFYSGTILYLDETAEELGGNSFRYKIHPVLEPWTVFIGPGIVANDGINVNNVWSYGNTLYVNTPGDDVVSVYTALGMLHRKYEVYGGLNKYTLEKGIYMVKLKDGQAYKIIIN